MRVSFWGVRGSIACPGTAHAAVGGNTSCVEVEVDGEILILDAGTGLRSLGDSLGARGIQRCSILLSHTHWDHTCGLPFFGPAYDPAGAITILAGRTATTSDGIREVLGAQVAPPHFPISLEEMRASITFTDITPGESFALRGANVRTAPLAHPGGATGFRIEHEGKSVAYVTDTEHDPLRPDERILALIEGADLMIYDSTYTDEEFDARRGWGHSTWQEGVRLCRAAGAKRLAIFHHDPSHDDAFIKEVERAAKRTWSGAFVACEGMQIDLAAAKPSAGKGRRLR